MSIVYCGIEWHNVKGTAASTGPTVPAPWKEDDEAFVAYFKATFS